MNVRGLSLQGFTVHDRFALELPERGVVLVTGPNGSGKSSVVEAVAFGLWGKTLRGTKPWCGGGGHVEVIASNVRVMRRPKSATVDDEDFPTLTAALAAVERMCGPFDVWRQSHVFSSADASRFTCATDAERKRLLETILGLERFDRAAERARHAEQLAAIALRSRGVERSSAEARYLEATRQLRAMVAPVEPESIEKIQAEIDVAEVEREQAAFAARTAQLSLSVIGLQERDAGVKVETARALRNAAAAGTCDRCGGPYTSEDIACAERALSDALEAAKVAHLTGGLPRQFYEAQHNAQEKRAGVALASLHALLARRERARAVLEVLCAFEASRAAAVARCAELARELLSAEEAVEEACAMEAQAEAVVAVLGLRGVRAHVLGRALTGVEAVGNAWLGKLGLDGLRVELRAHTHTAGGEVRDVIALEVHGAGGGHGYHGASGGERRRIDIALMLALAEISSAAHGRAPGTLFFDEVLDALDVDGVDAVLGCVRELAEDRAVVIISHSETLVSRLRPDVHVQMERGA